MIIVGCGETGKKLIYNCKDENNIVVIDQEAGALKEFQNLFFVETVLGDGSDIRTLTSAGVENCNLLFAVTGNDHVNLLTSLIARELFNVKQVICRLDNSSYYFLIENEGINIIGFEESSAEINDYLPREGR